MNERKLKVSKDIESEIEKVANKLSEVRKYESDVYIDRSYKELCISLSDLLSMHGKIGNSYFIEIEDRNAQGNNRKFRLLKDWVYDLYKSTLEKIELELDEIKLKLKKLLEENNVQEYRRYLQSYEKLVGIFKKLDYECSTTEKNKKTYEELIK